MAEQLTCNQQVDGSTPFTSSKILGATNRCSKETEYGGIPERPKGADCKSVVTDFGGPNPPSPTKKRTKQMLRSFFIQAAGLVWNQRAPRVVWNPDEVAHGIARSAYRIKFLRLGAIRTQP